MTESSSGPRLLVVVASRNPVKLDAADRGFRLVFPGRAIELAGADVASGVADQPWSDAETRQGAANRAAGARNAHPEADYWIGIEGGLADDGAELEAFAWVVIESALGQGRSRSSSFVLPADVADLVRGGEELGHAVDRVFGRSNTKQREGAVGLLTGGVIDRRSLYEPSVVLALAPLAHPVEGRADGIGVAGSREVP